MTVLARGPWMSLKLQLLRKAEREEGPVPKERLSSHSANVFKGSGVG